MCELKTSQYFRCSPVHEAEAAIPVELQQQMVVDSPHLNRSDFVAMPELPKTDGSFIHHGFGSGVNGQLQKFASADMLELSLMLDCKTNFIILTLYFY